MTSSLSSIWWNRHASGVRRVRHAAEGRTSCSQRTEKELHTYEDHVEKCVCTWHRAAFL